MTSEYRNPALTVDALVVRQVEPCAPSAKPDASQFQVLLIQREKEPHKGSWAFPGGFVDYGEDPVEAVKRELREETRLETDPNTEPHLVAVRGHPSRDPRQHIVTIGYAVKVDERSLAGMKGDDDAADARWFKLVDACNGTVPLAFDHRHMAVDFGAWLLKGAPSGYEKGMFVSL